MARNKSVGILSLYHACRGSTLGVVKYRSVGSINVDDLVACDTVALAASAIIAVRAGIGAFILLSVERAA
jgi:hypothetical protein